MHPSVITQLHKPTSTSCKIFANSSNIKQRCNSWATRLMTRMECWSVLYKISFLCCSEYFNDLYNRPDLPGYNYAPDGTSISIASPSIDTTATTLDKVRMAGRETQGREVPRSWSDYSRDATSWCDVVATALHKIFCRVWDDDKLPQLWKNVTVVPVCKKRADENAPSTATFACCR